MNIVGITARKGSGKDEAALALANKKGYIIESFARPLYMEVALAFGVTVDFLNERETKEAPSEKLSLRNCIDERFRGVAFSVLSGEWAGKGEIVGAVYDEKHRDYFLSPRRVLQLWGTEYRRKEDNNYWVRKLSERVKNYEGSNVPGVVIADVREPMEAALVKRRNNGLVLRIVRPDNPYEGGATANHSSETLVDSLAFDIEIVNDGSVEELHAKVVESVEAFYNER